MKRSAPNLAKAALWYAQHGYPVFPCTPRGKTPLTEHGCKDATTDAGQIRAWWQQWPTANIGVATGPHLTVLDIDPDKGGLTWLDNAPNELLPVTPTVNTGGGGYHKWYLTPPGLTIPNSAGRIAAGIDVRGGGGYVIAPPSIHPTGTPYTWSGAYTVADTAPAPMPPPLVLLMLPPDPAADHLETLPPRSDGPSAGLAERKLDRALSRAGGEGRNNMGFWLACQLRDNSFSEMDAEQILLDYQRRCFAKAGDPYLAKDALESVKQAYRHPARQPDPLSLPPAPPPAPPLTADHLAKVPDFADVPADELPALFAQVLTDLAALRADLDAERAAHAETQRRLDKRNAHIQWTHDIMRMPNTPPGEKITLYFARWQMEYAKEHPPAVADAPPKVPAGMVRLNLENLAEVSGQSAAAVGRHIKHASTVGILRRQAVKALGTSGQRVTQVYVDVPPEFFTKPSLLAPDERPNWGGKRERCAQCGSTRLKSVAFQCQDCLHVQAADGVDPAALPDAIAIAKAPPKARKRPVNIGAAMALDKRPDVPAIPIGDISLETPPADHLESAAPEPRGLVTVRVATALQDASPTYTADRTLAPQTRKRFDPPLMREERADRECWLCGDPRPCRCDRRMDAADGSPEAAL
jgi:hypothetical protein